MTNIRALYGQALETFFAMLFATLQAPYCVVGWLQKYNRRDLLELINIVTENREFKLFKVFLKQNRWECISETINLFDVTTSEHRNDFICQFAKFWKLLAKDFIDDRQSAEYNSIKHGFRIEHGGFKLSIGKNTSSGHPTDTKGQMLLGSSKYGSTIQKIEPLINSPKNSKVFTLRRTSFNWDPKFLLKRLQLIGYSLCNIQSFIKAIHKGTPKKELFKVPDESTLFSESSLPNAGVSVFDMDYTVQYSSEFEPIEDEIKKEYLQKIFFSI